MSPIADQGPGSCTGYWNWSTPCGDAACVGSRHVDNSLWTQHKVNQNALRCDLDLL